MNKKRLSVVMAGAMLASSVAPVLAATESEVDSSRLGGLVDSVYEKLTGKVFSKEDTAEANKSVYYVKVNGEVQSQFDTALDTDTAKSALRNALQEKFKTLKAGDKVEIYSKGFREADGKVLSTTTSSKVVYTSNDFATNENDKEDGSCYVNATTKAITKALRPDGAAADAILATTTNCVRVNKASGTIEIYFKKDSNVPNVHDDGTYDILTIKPGDEVLDFTKFYTTAAKDTVATVDKETTAAKIYGFPVKYATEKDIAEELIETIKITGTQYNYKTEDLYDGLMLTTAGHDLLTLVKETDAQIKAGVQNASIDFETLDESKYSFEDRVTNANSKYDLDVKLPSIDNEYGFVIRIVDAFGKESVYTIKGSEKYTNTLATWLRARLARVDILAGDNRYETAVSIAKEQALVNAPSTNTSTDIIKDIVLVNGNSLVDGLSAAPLAAKLQKTSSKTTPVLLTEADELPKATKAYLFELMKNHVIGSKETAKIHLVGGTAVLNRSLEKELEAMGFEVVRYNGANREETSLAVAKEINGGTLNFTNKNVFVVGAEGEADAMSVSGAASRDNTPIIVSKKGGLTYEGLEAIEDSKVTVVGGEKAVSAAEYEAIKEEAKAIRRIAGENRQATNAAIIKEFYYNNGIVSGSKPVESVIVAKDGKGNNGQLIDALTAANLAAQTNAPVVLATNSLSADQLDALQLRAKSSKSLYQVGIGVDKDNVVKVIADRLGLLNK